MMPGWSLVNFGSLLDGGVRNGLYKPKSFHGSGAKIINMGELFAHPRLGDVPMRRLEISESEAARFAVEPGDLLFARRSLVAEGAGQCCLVTAVPELTVFESSLIRARPDPTKADSAYIYYFFSSPQGRSLLQTILRQVAVAGITGTDLVKLEIPLAPLQEQRRISNALQAFDEKIEHNAILSQKLADIINLKCSQLLEGSAAYESLSSVARFVNGRAFTKDATGSGRPILRIKELNGGVAANTLWADLEASDDNVACDGDLLFAWSGSLDVYRWVGHEALINQHIFKVVPSDGYPLWLVEYWIRLHLREFRGIAADKATTMGHIRRGDLDVAQVPLPLRAELAEAEPVLGALDELRIGLLVENSRLRTTRSLLLPRLVGGEIRLSETYDPQGLDATAPKQAIAAVSV